MTKQEQTGERSLEFSRWIRENLPDSQTGLCVTNIDWVFYNWRTKKLMLCEEKTHMAKLSKWFEMLISYVIEPALRAFCRYHAIQYKGYHLIQFDGTSPDDGKIFVNGKLMDKKAFTSWISLQ